MKTVSQKVVNSAGDENLAGGSEGGASNQTPPAFVADAAKAIDRRQAVEIAVLTVLLVVVWGLLLLPIVFYHLPVHETESVSTAKL